MKRKQLNTLFFILILALIVFTGLFLQLLGDKKEIADNTENIQINNNEIQFNSLTQKQS